MIQNKGGNPQYIEEKPKPLHAEEFWKKNGEGKITILHHMLIKYLEDQGMANMKLSNGTTILVQTNGNIVCMLSQRDIDIFIRTQLEAHGDNDVLEKFSGGVPSYLSPRKLGMLKEIPPLKAADEATSTWFYFKNIAVKVTATDVDPIAYAKLPHRIWEKEIILHDYTPTNGSISQFEQFVFNISGKDQRRFLALKSAIGYLLSRYNYPSNPKAVILVDQLMAIGAANGGTGKSMIARAIGMLRNVVTVDGRRFKPNNRFCNQRIEHDTHVVCYQDMQPSFNLEIIFSMMTDGVSVDQKFKPEIFIEPEDAPKVMITSNYPVKGPIGNANKRRRWDYEVAPHYGPHHKPEDEFGNLFFSGWDEQEWSRFFEFMIGCAQTYLKEGLIPVKPINLAKNQLIAQTSPEFAEFIEKNLVLNKEMDKRKFLELYEKETGITKVTPHALYKMLKTFADISSYALEVRSSGGNYYFLISDNISQKEDGKEEGDYLQGPKSA